MSQSRCRWPEHHPSSSRGPGVVVGLAVVLAAAVVVRAVSRAVAGVGHFLAAVLHAVSLAGLVLAVVLVLAAVAWLAGRSRLPASWRYLPAMLWHRARWRRLARNLRLSYEDKHRKGVINCPRARFRPDAFGWTVGLRLIPGIGREDVEDAADYLADAWGAHRVGIVQPKPGRLLVRAMRRDPLAEPLPSTVLPEFDGRRLLLGRDEFGQLRFARLDTISGSVIGGLPGRGKSVLAAAFAVQLAVPIVDTYIVDGGGGADWAPWSGRAKAYADDLAGGVGVLELAHEEMTKRLRSVAEVTGHRNAWVVGPSEAWPMCWSLIDECHVFLDIDSGRALGKQAEQQVRSCRMLIGELLRRGRKVMMHTTLIAQKPTSSSIPPDLRDLAGLRMSFAASTNEMAVASLGDDIRSFPTLNPTGLQGDENIGVAVARLVTGSDLFTRLRVPFVTEDQADAVARVPAEVPAPVTVP